MPAVLRHRSPQPEKPLLNASFVAPEHGASVAFAGPIHGMMHIVRPSPRTAFSDSNYDRGDFSFKLDLRRMLARSTSPVRKRSPSLLKREALRTEGAGAFLQSPRRRSNRCGSWLRHHHRMPTAALSSGRHLPLLAQLLGCPRVFPLKGSTNCGAKVFRSGDLMQRSSRSLISWTAIEYGVIAVGTVLAIIAALQLVGTALR